jgi:hypothetical protein
MAGQNLLKTEWAVLHQGRYNSGQTEISTYTVYHVHVLLSTQLKWYDMMHVMPGKIN